MEFERRRLLSQRLDACYNAILVQVGIILAFALLAVSVNPDFLIMAFVPVPAVALLYVYAADLARLTDSIVREDERMHAWLADPAADIRSP